MIEAKVERFYLPHAHFTLLKVSQSNSFFWELEIDVIGNISSERCAFYRSVLGIIQANFWHLNLTFWKHSISILHWHSEESGLHLWLLYVRPISCSFLSDFVHLFLNSLPFLLLLDLIVNSYLLHHIKLQLYKSLFISLVLEDFFSIWGFRLERLMHRYCLLTWSRKHWQILA